MIKDDVSLFAPVPANENFISTMKTVINAIGTVKTNDRTYSPRMGKNNFTRVHNLFIPQAEQISFRNLRQTVTALADVRTPVEYRRRFHRNNPIRNGSVESRELGPNCNANLKIFNPCIYTR